MKRFFTAFLAIATSLVVSAQDSFYDDYNNFLKEALEEYNSFREQANKEYADFLAAPWESVNLDHLKKPVEKTRPPRPIEEEGNRREDHSFNYDNQI